MDTIKKTNTHSKKTQPNLSENIFMLELLIKTVINNKFAEIRIRLFKYKRTVNKFTFFIGSVCLILFTNFQLYAFNSINNSVERLCLLYNSAKIIIKNPFCSK